ncbi:MAG: hypothetical protein JWP79_2881 [Polaromonas sp.]|nr:hypothetical protein [Polaromonas sp.]MDB5845571.1 hypothetical protein [Polaromonas sp.]MDB5938639.1 hypothetical protein [Polaromonas sp.]
MNKQLATLALAAGACMALASGVAQAESTYGYNLAGTGTVVATAKVNIAVAVPKLILLRVGSDAATVDTVTLSAVLNPGIPGGITAAAVATAGTGDSLPSGWDKTAPIFTAAAGTPVAAASWTNSSGGASVTCSVTTAFTGPSGLTSAHITVANSLPLAGGALAHPGATTACGTPTTVAKNTLVGSTWTYSVSAAGLLAASAGTNTETVTYTATSI